MLQRPSTSGTPLQWWDGPAKAARPHLSPHGQPSFNMAAVGRTAALTLSVSGCSDGTCPRFFWDKFHLEHPDHHPQPGSAFLGVGRCAAAPSARTQRPFCPATSQPCADRSPLLPLQVAQWSPPSPTTATAPRPEIVGTLSRPFPPPPASLPPAEASRARYACAVCVHMWRACTCIVPLHDAY